MVIAAETSPACCGRKWTLNVAVAPTASVSGRLLELSAVNAVLLRVNCETTTGFAPELLSVILLLPAFPTLTDPNSMLVGETVKPLIPFEPRDEESNALLLPQPEKPSARERPTRGMRYRNTARAARPTDASVKEEEEATGPHSANCGTRRQFEKKRMNLNIFN